MGLVNDKSLTTMMALLRRRLFELGVGIIIEG